MSMHLHLQHGKSAHMCARHHAMLAGLLQALQHSASGPKCHLPWLGIKVEALEDPLAKGLHELCIRAAIVVPELWLTAHHTQLTGLAGSAGTRPGAFAIRIKANYVQRLGGRFALLQVS